MSETPAISLTSDVFFNIGPFAITNSLITTFATSILLIFVAFLVRRKAGVVPSKPQIIFESITDFMWDKALTAFNGNEKRAKKFFPLILTIFLFLLFANQFMLIPFAESIVTADGINLFRSPASDYSLPIVLTVFILLLANGLALAMHPIRHIGNFIKIGPFFKIKKLKEIPMAFLDLFLGLLDIVGEMAKLASLSTRLFGNMFAGSIIVLIISSLSFYTQFFVPIPFVVLGILSGVVQAFVFAMLAMLFINQSLSGVDPVEIKEQTN
jgi:F-type H+-transporting ATPase subunit a